MDTFKTKFDYEKMRLREKHISYFKKRLDELGWEQKDLAEKIEVNKNTITTAFTGKDVSIHTINKITAVLGGKPSRYIDIDLPEEPKK